jgi:hypothetical protein
MLPELIAIAKRLYTDLGVLGEGVDVEKVDYQVNGDDLTFRVMYAYRNEHGVAYATVPSDMAEGAMCESVERQMIGQVFSNGES